MTKVRFFLVFLVLLVFLCVGCGNQKSYNTLVIAVQGSFNGVFSPFNATTGYDMTVVSFVHASLWGNDRLGLPRSSLAEYVPPVEVRNDFGDVVRTVFTFRLLPDVFFSNGEPITADDVLFSYYVYCDPSYMGASTIYTTPIIGVEEYRSGSASSIEGIRRIDDRTVEVSIYGSDPKAVWNLGGIAVVPRSYYNDGKELVKGNLAAVNAKDRFPVGAGAFAFVKFENKVVHLVRNEHYFMGVPHIAKIKLQEVPQMNTLDAVLRTDVDIGEPFATPETLRDIELSGIHYELIDNPGYGYIGINASRVPNKDVRKGLMCLMNRFPAVHSYYGDLASVIERPMSRVSWAYPSHATAVYSFDPDRALAYFTAAGYSQVSRSGKTILEKDGKQLYVEVGIGGQGLMDHPAAPILTQMKQELDKLGGVLDIQDVDPAILFDKLDAKQWDMWVAAWGSSIDPDMYQIYYSTGPTNHYSIDNLELDHLILDARRTTDRSVRSALYERCLDIVMDEAVEMPVYQRKNVEIYNPAMVDILSLPENATPYYGYSSEIERVRMVE